MLYACCALPRSGKSTFANFWVMHHPNRAIVSGDAIRLALTGQRYNPSAEGMVESTRNLMIKSLLLRNATVLHDGTNTTLHSVGTLEKIAKNTNEKLTWIIFETPPDICKDRAIKTKQEDLICVIDRMMMEFPSTRKYLIDKYSGKDGPVKLDENTVNAKIIHDFDGDVCLCVDNNGKISRRRTNLIRIIHR